MTANQDPAAQSNADAAGAARPGHDLEDWLSDLRTEVAADPPGWIDEEPGSDRPTGRTVEHSQFPAEQAAPAAAEPSRGGRHRAPEQ
jgi:hypothetical protein